MRKGRYDVSNLVESQNEPGSNGGVLKNLVGIKNIKKIEELETNLLVEVTDEMIFEFELEHRFLAKDVCYLHQRWLGSIYEWAGHYRQVNISKDGFCFAMVAYIPQLMKSFEEKQLRQYTPCVFNNKSEVIRALAEVHIEFILIHPFRDGNGRVARLLATLMALQAGLPLLDFTLFHQKKDKYIEAIHYGVNKDYAPMEKLFSQIIETSLKKL